MLLLCVHSTACILKVLFTLIERDIKLAIMTAGRQTTQVTRLVAMATLSHLVLYRACSHSLAVCVCYVISCKFQ